MAIIHHTATISPTKQEMLDRLLGEPVTILGVYRFDDPAGQVGVEGFIVRVGDRHRHVVLTYRGEELDTEAHLVTTMQHTVLGRRWIYDGLSDPVALGCFQRAIAGGQDQAPLELWENGHQVGTREQSVIVTAIPGEKTHADATVTIRTDLDGPAPSPAGPRLHARWENGEAVVASLD